MITVNCHCQQTQNLFLTCRDVQKPLVVPVDVDGLPWLLFSWHGLDWNLHTSALLSEESDSYMEKKMNQTNAYKHNFYLTHINFFWNLFIISGMKKHNSSNANLSMCQWIACTHLCPWRNINPQPYRESIWHQWLLLAKKDPQ
jgi:hypothetical protein